MKFYILFFIFIFSSCQDRSNVQILNNDLTYYVKKFIDEIDKSGNCKSKYITIEITETKVYICNTVPTLRKDFLGYMEFEKSVLYFYSSEKYSNFIEINNKSYKSIEKDYINDCHPAKDIILLIDKVNTLKPIKKI